MRVSLRGAFTFFLSVTFLVSFTGCGKKISDLSGEKFVLSCGASDQRGGYKNPIDARTEVALTVDSRFSDEEKASIENAVHTWNEFQTTRIVNRPLYKIVSADLSASDVPENNKDCGFPGSGSSLSIVKETDATKWEALGLTSQNPGVTIRCSAGNQYVARQVIFLNPKYAAKVQFESIVLHELGHSIGLDHSCAAQGGVDGLVTCDDEIKNDADHPYHQAIMYPWLSSNAKEIEAKKSLQSNDQERASCILGIAVSGV